jgi:hypothetical protein
MDTPVGRQFLSSSFGFRVREVMRVFCNGRHSRLPGGGATSCEPGQTARILVDIPKSEAKQI